MYVYIYMYMYVYMYTLCPSDEVSGECFLVERYESDVEEGGEEGEHILLTLSDRFLEEKDANGEVRLPAPLKACNKVYVYGKWTFAHFGQSYCMLFTHKTHHHDLQSSLINLITTTLRHMTVTCEQWPH